MVFATPAMQISVGEMKDMVSQLEDGHFVKSNLDVMEFFTVPREVILTSRIMPILVKLSKDWFFGPSAARVLKKFNQVMKQHEKKEPKAQKALKRKSSEENGCDTKAKYVRTEDKETPTTPKMSGELRKASEVMRLADKLNALPPSPSAKDVDRLLPGLTAQQLKEAESLIGKRMNRVQRVWWALVHRDFGTNVGQNNCDVREIYDNQRQKVEGKENKPLFWKELL